ncbi:class I SAM-dependent methyltransferase, partial [Pantoea sp. SIMBA_079]
AAGVASRATGSRPGTRILDAGAGTGYYLRAALAAVPSAAGLALDLSPQAVARAVRSSGRVDGVVADTWRPLPVRSSIADAVLDVFAP